MIGVAVKTIGIVGTRRRNTGDDFLLVEKAFLKVFQRGDRICSGKCPKGGDRFAVVLAALHNTPTLWFPADWERYGRSAGFVRNTDIARESDVLIACAAGDRTGGTEDTIMKWMQFHPNGSVILV